MIESIPGTVKSLILLAHLRPGIFLMVFGMAVLGLKIWRHKSRRTRYSLKDVLKYWDDAALTIGAAVMFLVGLLRFLFM